MADKMKAEDIVNALEFCSHCECNNDKTETECPLINMPFCKNYLRKQSLDLIIHYQAESERLQGEIKEKTRMVFEKVINKFLSIKDLYVVIDGETVPWEPIEKIEYLFGMTLSGENEEIEKETDRVIKELLDGESNGL